MTTDATIKFDDLSINTRQGLNAEQIRLSTEKYGRNTLTPPERDPWWKQLLEKFEDPTIRILVAAAVISLLMAGLEWMLGHEASWIEPIGIIMAVLLATLAGFFSEMKSAGEFEKLNNVKDDIRVKVLRDGQIVEISINDVVVGDLVRLDLGDKVPADGVVIDAMNLLIDQAVMTGESVPVEKHAAETADGGLQTADESSTVFRGTMISDGHGMFLVTTVGDKTRLGQIAANLGAAESESETPLTQKLSVLAKQISAVGVTGAMTIFAIMALKTVGGSPLFGSLSSSSFAILSVISVVLGFLAMRFALRPFFASMDMELNNKGLQTLACLPMVIAAFAFLLGFWGLFNSPEIAAEATEKATNLSMDLFRSLLICFVIAVTVIVVAVPEGLPMMVTIALALNMMKMAKENCLIRKLVASETIGSATVICTDKTGTLTLNQMTVTWGFSSQQESASIDQWKHLPDWDLLTEALAVNNEATLCCSALPEGKR